MRKYENYGQVNVVQNENFLYAVIDNDGNIIVPYGKYGWISGFCGGLARVVSYYNLARSRVGSIPESEKWGIIDEKGNEVLPLEYDEIWNFMGKGRNDTKVVIDGVEKRFDLKNRKMKESYSHSSRGLGLYRRYDEYNTHYGEYAGSYAQDVEGYSDDVIDDAFDGDPDAYWNID